ncbi:MAG TPA: AsmA-like C-terminal domain-containing protein [Candidatus Sulfobium mesophilum]|nr:AsmA-like C-terminal domain-containing protein [Candidatus Sulfobium mesophilum]
MNTKRRIFLLLASLTGLIFILFFVLYYSAAKLIDSEFVKEKIRVYLLEKAGTDITFANSEFHLFPLPEIIFDRVGISIPYKAEGSASSLRVYPNLFSLIRGNFAISKVGIEAPRFTFRISKDTEKPTLEKIEEKVRSITHYLVSETPGVQIVIRDGKLDVKEEEEIAFSFDLIKSRLNTSKKTVDIELASRSNLWDNISISSSIEAGDLKSKGTIRLTRLHPKALIAGLPKKSVRGIGISDVDLSMKFQASGLKMVHVSTESSVSDLSLSRGKKQISLGEAIIKGNIKIEPDTVSVLIDEAKISRPALNLSGQYTRNRSSGMTTADLKGESIAVQPLREAALAVGGDISLITDIFTYMQGGKISTLHIHSSGKSLDELGRTNNIRITGKMHAGVVYIKSKDLTIQDVAGDVVISEGILKADHVGASVGNNSCSGGKLRVGLKGKDATFHLDTLVKTDVEELPSLLKDKHLLENEAVLHEMDRVHNLRGKAEGRLTLGDRLDSVHVKILIDNMNLSARYEPLPFPLAVTKGKFFFDEKNIELADSGGSIGGSSFSGLTARLRLADPNDLEIVGGRLSLSAGEIYPWITSFEKIRPVLNDVRSLDGTVFISGINLRGPLYQPKEWKFQANGEAKNLTVDAAFLPGKAEEMNGTFAITQNELSLKNIHSKIIDSMITVSGSVREFPSDIRNIELVLQGKIGQEVNTWIAELIKLPPELKIRSPFSVADGVLSIEKSRQTAFSGMLLFGQGTQVSLNVTKTPDSTLIRDLTVKDRSHDLAASIALTKETIDLSLKGTLTSQGLNSVFVQSTFSDAALEGAFRAHIVLEHPNQSTAEGRLKVENIPIPLGSDIPVVARHIALEAKKQSVVINMAELAAGDMTFKARGTASSRPEWFAVDMDISANGIDWETFAKMLQKREHAARKDTAVMKDFPVRGTMRLKSDFFRYLQFKLEPFNADVSFDGKKVLIAAKKAALCDVSTTGYLSIEEKGIKLDISVSAKDLEFRPTILCLSNRHSDFTGTFQMDARLRGEGKISEIADRLDGTFTLSARDGKILRSDKLDKTFNLLNESENFKGQFPDLEREKISYSAINIRGAIRENRILIEEAILDSSVIGILMRGSVDISEETLNINAFISPLKTGKIPILGHVMGGTLVSVPVKISGNIKDPKITFLSPSAVASETLGILGRLFKLPVTLVEPVFKQEKK